MTRVIRIKKPYDPKQWIQLVTHISSKHGSVIPVVLPKVLMVLLICLVIIFVNNVFWDTDSAKKGLKIPATAHSYLASTLGFLLVLRTNISLARYREGRAHLGAMSLHLRNLSRQAAHFIGRTNPGAAAKVCRFCKLFISLTRMHLRRDSRFNDPEHLSDDLYTQEELDLLMSPEMTRRPLKVLGWLDSFFRELRDSNQLTELEELHLEKHLEGLTGTFASLIKVQTVQLPFPYAQTLWMFLSLYVYSLPFTLVTSFGNYTMIPACLIALVLFSLNAVGNDLEDPFGDDVNDLEVDQLEIGTIDDIEWYLQLATSDDYTPDALLRLENIKISRKFKGGYHPMPTQNRSSESGATDDVDGHVVGAVDAGYVRADRVVDDDDDGDEIAGTGRSTTTRRRRRKNKSRAPSDRYAVEQVTMTSDGDLYLDANADIERSSSF